MKELDEAEKLAREWTEEYQSSLSVGELSNRLASAVLAMVPVVRAAETWRDTMDWSSSRVHGEVFTCEHSLYGAVTDMRATLRRGGK